MCEKNKKKKRRKVLTSVSADKNGLTNWGKKEDGELSDSSISSVTSAVTDDEQRRTINELADEDSANTNQQTNEVQQTAQTNTDATSAITTANNTNQQAIEVQQTTQTNTDATSAVTTEETHQSVQTKTTTDGEEMATNNIHEEWTPTTHEINFSSTSGNSDKLCVFIDNFDASTTEQDLLSLFRLDSTLYTKKCSSIEITHNGRGKYKVYAKLQTHYKFALENPQTEWYDIKPQRTNYSTRKKSSQ